MKTGENTYTLPTGSKGKALKEWANRKVILGLRPEHISDGFPQQAENQLIHPLESVVQVVEPTGPDSLVFIRINDAEVTCRVHPHAAVSPGREMTLMMDMDSALFFDPDTEDQIS